MLFYLKIDLLRDYYGDSDEGFPWTLIIAIAIIGYIAVRLYAASGRRVAPSYHWFVPLDNYNYSTKTIYQNIWTAIKDRSLPGVTMRTDVYSESGTFSANREYLLIERRRLVFAICAAPFGKGFFISYWQFTQTSTTYELLYLIPFLGKKLYDMKSNKTFFEIDTEQMYKLEVERAVEQVINTLSDEAAKRNGNVKIERVKGTVDAAFSF